MAAVRPCRLKHTKRRGEKTIYRTLVALMLVVPLFAGCSSSNNSSQSQTELRNCIVVLEPAFKLERSTIYEQYRAIIKKAQANPQDPTVKPDLAAVAGEITSVDQGVQATTCQTGGFDYLRTVQGVSSGLKSSIDSFNQGIASQTAGPIQQAAQQLTEITKLLQHAADITTPTR